MEIQKLSGFTDSLAVIKSSPEKQLFFRGHSDEAFSLTPSLYRAENYYLSEDKIFKDTILTNPQDFIHCKNTIEVLVKMQHYGIPTRLLDLTRNALVALFFACEANNDRNGEFIILHIPNDDVCYFDSDKVCILSNLAKQPKRFEFQYDDNLNKKNIKYINKEYFGYLLHSIKEDKPHFQNIINPKDIEKVYAVQTKLDNPRIIRQNGAFLIFGNNKKKSAPAIVNDNWILKPNGERIIISAKAKANLLKELDVLGINNSTLFPELANQSDYIRERYK